MSMGGVEKRPTTAHATVRCTRLMVLTFLTSPEWAKAGEAGRRARQVQPFTDNRRHVLY
jgi:hypothetical protein